jgi:hypothetical protein
VATIREAGQTSEEMMGLLEEEDEEESPLPDEDVFAELADPDELLFTTTEKSRKGLKTKGLFGLHKPKIAVTPMKFEAKDAVQARDFEVDSVPDEDDGENSTASTSSSARRVPPEARRNKTRPSCGKLES